MSTLIVNIPSCSFSAPLEEKDDEDVELPPERSPIFKSKKLSNIDLCPGVSDICLLKV